MALATRLSIYNGACLSIGERRLVNLNENRESRRALDDIWDRGGVRTCLSAGQWFFGRRGIQWNYDPDLPTPFGYQCAFEHPADWVRWMAVCTDAFFQVPLLQYVDEGGFFYCDLQELFVAYVSDDPAFGMNLAAWPDNFQRYVEHYFGEAICLRVTGDEKKRKDAEGKRDRWLIKAKSTDAMNEATTLLPAGQWRQARHGRRGNIERGNPFSLYG